MKAPFQVGGTVEPPYFVGRDEVLKEIVVSMSTLSKNFLIIGPRRIGKSSLMLNIRSGLAGIKDLLVVDVNCIEATSYFDFSRLVTEKVLESYQRKRRVKGLLEIFKRALKESILEVLKSVQKIGGSFAGVVEVYISFRENKIKERELAVKTFNFLEKFSKEKKLNMVILLDEFQKVADFNNKIFALLKSRIDNVKNVRYIFSGSSLSVLQKVFLKPKSALYMMATKKYLKPVEDEHVKKFILQRLKGVGMKIDPDALDEICNLVKGMPFYFQKLADMSYYKALLKEEDGNRIDKKNVAEAFKDMMNEFDSEFEFRFTSSFSPRHQAILKAIAKGGDEIRVSEIAKELRLLVNELGKDMKLLCDSLTTKRINRGKYDIVDKVFKRWLAER